MTTQHAIFLVLILLVLMVVSLTAGSECGVQVLSDQGGGAREPRKA
jgi:hypothetical protein